MTKQQFVAVLETLTNVQPERATEILKKANINYQSIEKLAKIVLALDSAFETSSLMSQQNSDIRTFYSLLYDHINKALKESGLDFDSTPKEIIFGVLAALLTKLAIIAQAAEMQAQTE